MNNDNDPVRRTALRLLVLQLLIAALWVASPHLRQQALVLTQHEQPLAPCTPGTVRRTPDGRATVCR
jgi:hypothetical protein